MNLKLIQKAAEAIKAGELAIVKTDTGYGLVADITSERAMNRLLVAKGRAMSKAVSIALPNVDQIPSIIETDSTTQQIVNKFMPGAITIVAPKRTNTDNNSPLTRFLSPPIVNENGEIGIRVPDDNDCLQLCRLVGAPITITSANISGKPAPFTRKAAEECARDLDVELIIGDTDCKHTQGSTVIRIADGRIQILREGVVSEKAIMNCLKS